MAAAVPSLTPERLRQCAFDALEEALAEAELGPVRRTWALRLALAYLASLHRRTWSLSEPYRDFWRALSVEREASRQHALERALGTIYSWADVKRDPERAAVIRVRTHAETAERRPPNRRTG